MPGEYPSVGDQVRAIRPVERTCNWYDNHTPDGEPCGNECRQPATHVIVWMWTATREKRWSFCCADHISPPAIDPPNTHGWDYIVVSLNDIKGA